MELQSMQTPANKGEEKKISFGFESKQQKPNGVRKTIKENPSKRTLS